MKTKILKGITAKVALSVIFASGAIFHNSAVAQEKEEGGTLINVGDKAPDFTVEMLDGRRLKLSDFKGKVVLLNFWATWCGPCMKEFEVIPDKIIKRFAGNEAFVFIPISREEKRETVEKKVVQLKKKGINFPVGIDPDRSIYSQYAVQFIPRNFLIDKDGKVVLATIGYEEAEFAGLVDMIEKILK
ncbi:MAG: TlpA family protein disulfide reductase [Tannerella sp.]|jgi:peroxiredoxin|nr:TlpA family protein disulfide reductase [Tannerella sp.]